MDKIDVEKLLLAGSPVFFPLTGYSMSPLFAGGRDKVVVVPIPNGYRFKRYDVVLYRRENSKLVLHRVYKVNANGIYLVGDNQSEIEGPLPEKQMRGIMTEAIRKGRKFSVNNFWYKCYSSLWMLIRPIRPAVLRILLKAKHKLKDS